MSIDARVQRPDAPRRIVFMLAGQGSQYLAMGREFYEQKPVFRDWMNFCSRRLAAPLGFSLVDLLYGPHKDRFSGFDQTRHTHPAIFAVNYCVAQTLIEEGVRPDCLLGYSLGELVAWTLAGILRLEEALALVVEMAVQIEDHTPPGAMLAIIGPPALVADRPEAFAAVNVGCLNYAENFVVTGATAAIAQLQRALRTWDVPHQLLPIQRGFHSPLLDPVEAMLKSAVARVPLRPPEIPVISAMLARELTQEDLNPQHCWEVVRAPVRFWDTIRGMETAGPATYIDVGPSGSLATFVRNIIGRDGASQAFPLLTPFGKDLGNLEKLRTGLRPSAPARR